MIDHTSSAFGARLLREWLSRPLANPTEIEARLDAVEEMVLLQSQLFGALAQELPRLPDLERGLSRLFFTKCSPKELLTLLSGFQRAVASLPKSGQHLEAVRSPLIRQCLEAIPDVRSEIDQLLRSISATAAAADNKQALFPPSEYEQVRQLKEAIEGVQHCLQEYLGVLRRKFGMPELNYTSKLQVDYLIELSKSAAQKLVPRDWTCINSTQRVLRYHSPYIITQTQKLVRGSSRCLVCRSVVDSSC